MSKLLAQYIEIYNILHIIPNTQKQPLKSDSLKSHLAISNVPTQLKFSGILRKHIKKVLFSVKISVAVKKYEINLEALFLSCCIQSWRVQLTHRQTVMAAWDWLIVLCVQCCYGDRAVLSASLQYTLFIFLAIVSLSYV